MNKSLSILVVDDELSNIDLITEVLKSADYIVASAMDGFKAVAACKVRMPDLILLDLQMPLMSGIDVFKRLRGDEKTRDIPIIFLRRKGEKPSDFAGEDDEHWVLSKPISQGELLSRVKAALNQQNLKKEIRKREVQIRELSLTDPLTSFRSLRYLAEFLKAEIHQCRRYLVPLSLVLLEVDGYADLLKKYGQAACTGLLCEIAEFIGKQNRQTDIVARLSESELGLFLTHTDLNGAVETAERLRDAISGYQFKSVDAKLPVTVSVGVAQQSDNMDEDGQFLISYARSAVDQAKSAGGNMTMIAE